MSDAAFDDCGGPWDLTLEHSKTNWEGLSTTWGETAVFRYLREHPELYQNKRLLHMGIGNGELFGQIGDGLAAYSGITISIPEIEHFERKFPARHGVRVLLANKHDPRNYDAMRGCYDVIVDVNLKSFSCCQRHFETYMSFVAEQLASEGILITAQSGVEFGWHGITERGYTPGMNPNPSFQRYRILGIDGLQSIGREYKLEAASVPWLVAHEGGTIDETLWILTKRAATP